MIWQALETEMSIAEIDLWNNAALAALRGQPCPAPDEHSIAGYKHGADARRVTVVMPRRPEGYYHAPIGTFD